MTSCRTQSEGVHKVGNLRGQKIERSQLVPADIHILLHRKRDIEISSSIWPAYISTILYIYVLRAKFFWNKPKKTQIQMAYCLAQQETFFLLELSSFFFKKENTQKRRWIGFCWGRGKSPGLPIAGLQTKKNKKKKRDSFFYERKKLIVYDDMYIQKPSLYDVTIETINRFPWIQGEVPAKSA
jgi:hypothetical protein